MSKAPGGKSQRTPAPRPSTKRTGHANAERLRAEAAQRRRTRILAASAASALVVVVIVMLIVVKLTGSTSPTTAVATTPVSDPPTPASVLTSLAAIAPSQLAQAAQAAGGNVGSPTPITDPPLTDGAKPEVLFIGAGFCPYCAAERWALVTALLQFGTFTGLTDSHSSSIDINPNTPTFSFHGVGYSSPYVSFTGVEETTNQPKGNSYVPLDTPTPAQQALFDKYTTGYPFVDFGGRFVLKGAQYNGKILAGLTVEQVAARATDVSVPIGEAIEASAGTLVRDICQLTGGKPANVCAPFPASSGG